MRKNRICVQNEEFGSNASSTTIDVLFEFYSQSRVSLVGVCNLNREENSILGFSEVRPAPLHL